MHHLVGIVFMQTAQLVAFNLHRLEPHTGTLNQNSNRWRSIKPHQAQTCEIIFTVNLVRWSA